MVDVLLRGDMQSICVWFTAHENHCGATAFRHFSMLCRWWQGSSKTAQQWRMGCFLPAWGALKLILQQSNVTDVNEIFDWMTQPGRVLGEHGEKRKTMQSYYSELIFALCVVECCVYCRWKTWALWVAGWTRNWIGIWTWIRAMARIVQLCGQFQSEGAIFNPNIRCHRILVLRFAPTKFPLRPIRPNGF